MNGRLIPALLLAAAVGCGQTGLKDEGRAKPARSSNEAKSRAEKNDDQLVREAMASKDLRFRVKTLEDVLTRVEDPEAVVWLKRQVLFASAELGDVEKVEKLAEEIPLEEDFEGSEVRNAIAYTYAEKGIKLEKARALIMQALNALDRMESDMTLPPRVSAEDTRGYYLDTLGWIDHKAGKNREAAAVLEEAARRLDHATIRLHLGEAYKALGEWEKAGQAYARASMLEGDDAKRARDLLQQLAGKVDVKALLDEARKIRDQELAKEKEARAKEMLRNRIEEAAPEFSMTDFDGKKLDNERLRQSVTVLDFWASWCPPCKEELPIYQSLYEKYKGQPVNFLAVSVDRYKEEAEAFLKDGKYSFPVAHDANTTVASKFDIQGIPTIVVIGPCGRINWVHQGFSRSVDIESVLSAQINTLLAEKNLSCEMKPSQP